MRLLRVITTVRPEAGGPVEGIRQSTKVLRELDNEVEIASLDAPDCGLASAWPCPVHCLGPGKSSYYFAASFRSWLARESVRFDAVVVSGLWQYPGLATWSVLHRSRTPYFVFPHGMLDPWFKRTYPLKHLKKWLYWPWAEYRVLRDAKAVLFTCEQERLRAGESFWLYRCNERVVNYGTAAPSGDPENQRAAFLGRFPHLRGKRLLLFLSRIHPKKGCDLLIKAYARVHAQAIRGDLHVVMAGPDQVGWAAELKNLAASLGVADRITWPGMLSGDVKWGAIRNADAFVLPSHQENFGIAVVEAMACGVPVLISDQVNIWREIEQDGAGLVAEDTEEGTLDLLNRWLALPESATAGMRQRAAASFLRRFEVHAAAESLLGVLAECVPTNK